jgi:prepilin-type N-terminal cleavage/methylation domain-containing protein
MNKSRGFTIVELLIVVVVITILAAITIVAYNGIQTRAKQSAAQSSAKQAYTKIKSYAVLNAEQLPPTIEAAGLANSDAASYQYRYDNSVNPKTFCLTVTVQKLSYYVTHDQSTPAEGACQGHGSNGVVAVTNIVPNPGSEAAAILSNNPGVGCTSALSNDAHTGLKSSVFTKNGNYCFARVLDRQLTNTSMSGKTYFLSAWVKAPINKIFIVFRANGSGYVSSQFNVPIGVWTKVSQPITVAASDTATPGIDIGYESAHLTDGTQFQVDSVMIIEGTTEYTYADGSSPGWLWNGTINNSPSTGPGRT